MCGGRTDCRRYCPAAALALEMMACGWSHDTPPCPPPYATRLRSATSQPRRHNHYLASAKVDKVMSMYMYVRDMDRCRENRMPARKGGRSQAAVIVTWTVSWSSSSVVAAPLPAGPVPNTPRQSAQAPHAGIGHIDAQDESVAAGLERTAVSGEGDLAGLHRVCVRERHRKHTAAHVSVVAAQFCGCSGQRSPHSS